MSFFSYKLQAHVGEYEFSNKQSGEMYKAEKVVRVIHKLNLNHHTFERLVFLLLFEVIGV